MMHTKFQGHRPFGSGEEDFFKGFYHRPAISPEITGFFIALPALRLSRENLRQNHKISGIFFFSDNILKCIDKIN